MSTTVREGKVSDKKDQSYTSWNSNSIILGDYIVDSSDCCNMSTTVISGTGGDNMSTSTAAMAAGVNDYSLWLWSVNPSIDAGTTGNTITLGATSASAWPTMSSDVAPYTKAALSFSSGDNVTWATSNTDVNNKISDLLMDLRDLILLCLGSSVLETTTARHFDTASQIINHNEIDVDELANLMEALKKRLLIIAPDFEKHEKYPMLKQLYDEYKALERLLSGPDSNNDNE